MLSLDGNGSFHLYSRPLARVNGSFHFSSSPPARVQGRGLQGGNFAFLNSIRAILCILFTNIILKTSLSISNKKC